MGDNKLSEPEYVEPDIDRERRIRNVVEKCIAPSTSVSPEYPLLSVRDAHWLLRQLDRARLERTP